MIYRFFDIVAENETGEYTIPNEYVLSLPNHDPETAVDRQEFLGLMLDSVVAASGLDICSFKSEEVNV